MEHEKTTAEKKAQQARRSAHKALQAASKEAARVKKAKDRVSEGQEGVSIRKQGRIARALARMAASKERKLREQARRDRDLTALTTLCKSKFDHDQGDADILLKFLCFKRGLTKPSKSEIKETSNAVLTLLKSRSQDVRTRYESAINSTLNKRSLG